jgi:hypothetical protein
MPRKEVAMRLILAVSLALTCAAASAGEVYKWKDKEGRVHYGDRPKDAQAESIMVAPSSGTGEASPAFSTEAQRQAECQTKRAQLQAWRAAPTMSEIDNLGKTRMYTSAEREQFLAMTQQKVDALCAPPPGPVQKVETFPPPEAAEPKLEIPPEEPPPAEPAP